MMTKVWTILFLIGAGIVGYMLINSIKTDIEFTERLELVKEQKIEKLEMIRDAAVAYEAVHGKYTASWDTLTNFVRNGNLYIVNKTEYVVELSYGRDSSIVKVDTIGSIPVMDSIFTAAKWPNFDVNTLSNIPFSDGKEFELFAGRIVKGGVEVNVFEARDIDPQDPKRRANNAAKALRVGSRTEVTTSGNWE